MHKNDSNNRREFDELYKYVKQLLNYDENQCLSKAWVLRLRGLSNNKFMDNNNISSTANYSYKVILNTFVFCSVQIKTALNRVPFKNENHKMNYILKIVESNLNDIYTKMKDKEERESQIQESNIVSENTIPEYKPHKNNTNSKLFDSLW